MCGWKKLTIFGLNGASICRLSSFSQSTFLKYGTARIGPAGQLGMPSRSFGVRSNN